MMDDEPLLDDVTQQAHALGQAFKESHADIKRLQTVRNDLEEKWLKGRAELDGIVLEGNSLVSQLCLLEEQRNKLKKSIISLEHEIHKATDEYKALTREITEKTLDSETMKRDLLEYTMKMKHHSKIFSDVENKTAMKKRVFEVEKEIEELQIKKTDLERKKMEMLTNSESHTISKEELMMQVSNMSRQIGEKQDDYESKKQELETMQQKRQGMEMTTMVLKKKNSALLIRLQRKLEEQKGRHSNCMAQRDYLRRMIDTTRRKLERFADTSS